MSVKKLKINGDNEGRRLDNYLLSIYKNIPKSKIYKIIRKGEVRVNSSRAKPYQKLCLDDLVRIPPIIQETIKLKKIVKTEDVKNHLSEVLHNDDNYLIINKQRGVSVHGGSKNLIGLIDIVRHKYGDNLDLCHRLDKNTTGCLTFGKNKKAVKHFNEAIKNKQITKIYQVIVKGHLSKNIDVQSEIYKVNPNKTKDALSRFSIIKRLRNCTYAQVQIYTGRTHQIRIHSASINHPVLFDNKYGDFIFNKSIQTTIQKSIALHSKSIIFKDINSRPIEVNSSMPADFKKLINELSLK